MARLLRSVTGSDTTVVPPFHAVGELASLSAALIWAGSICAHRHFGRGLPPDTFNLFKYLISLTCLIVSVLIFGFHLPKDIHTIGLLLASGIVGLAVGDNAFFAALQRLGAQSASAVQCLAPPFAAILAAVFLGERLSMYQEIGIGLTVFSVASAIYFGRNAQSVLPSLPRCTLILGFILAVIAAAATAAGVVLTREALQHSEVLSGTMIRIFPALCIVLISGMLRGGGGQLKGLFSDRRRVIGLGIASFYGAFVGLLLMAVGAKYAKAGVSTTLLSTYPIWIIPVARFFLNEKVNPVSAYFVVTAVIGVGLMFMGG